jgi:hypothetical protein
VADEPTKSMLAPSSAESEMVRTTANGTSFSKQTWATARLRKLSGGAN